jgi:DNA-binding IclR family transcriptional regulator
VRQEAGLSVAVKRISEVIDALAEAPQGATALEIATRLGMGRQAATRLLDAMVAIRLADKEPASRRYLLGLHVYSWGSAAVGRFVPPIYLRYELAELAEEVQHPVFYSVLDGAFVVTIERTQRRGRQTLTIPDFRRNPWHATSSGRVIAAFSPAGRLKELLQESGAPSRKTAEEDFETIRRDGFAASDAIRGDGYALAAPVLNESGEATAAIGIGVNKYVAEERALITSKLLDLASRASFSAGYGAPLINA